MYVVRMYVCNVCGEQLSDATPKSLLLCTHLLKYPNIRKRENASCIDPNQSKVDLVVKKDVKSTKRYYKKYLYSKNVLPF